MGRDEEILAYSQVWEEGNIKLKVEIMNHCATLYPGATPRTVDKILPKPEDLCEGDVDAAGLIRGDVFVFKGSVSITKY